MELFVEQAATYEECLRKIHAKYGTNARINVMRQNAVRIKKCLGLLSREGVEVSGIVYDDYTRAAFAPANPAPKKQLNFEEERQKILAENGKNSTTLKLVLDEVRTIKETIKEELKAGAAAKEEHPNLVRIEDLLTRNDFSPAYIKGIMERARKEFPLETLEDPAAVREAVLEWIGGSIGIYAETKPESRPRIMVLIGPTGVGKTTTIAKLAAIYGTDFAGRKPLEARLITIDNYRIGAEQQIESYGEIMGLPVSVVKNYRDLKQAIALNTEDMDLILIDTIGKSPQAAMELGEMRQLLNACGPSAEYHLVIAATTKSSDIGDILQQFELFGYRSVIITKMDETSRIGNVVSALAAREKKISFITEGQTVPHDIQKASVLRFLMNLEGFTINRDKLEKRFPRDEFEYIKWRE
jgi:flagellar biosynthesis protein FlhF